MKRFALVCGASGEIGTGICRELASIGWSLYVHYNSGAARAGALVSELSALYPTQEFMTVQADFSAADGADRLASQIFSLHAVIFSSGQAYNALLDDTPVDVMDALWRVHVQNPMRLLALLGGKLRQNKRSHVVFISSIWGATGAASESVYSAVKGAQISFVKAYAKEAAFNGIRVNAVAPGFIDTSMNAALVAEEREWIIDEIPLQSFGAVSDIAETVSFLVNGKADYMTGQVLHVNGGWFI
jgi:3-oxoacyl-[acyl-carrier protein] reductase